jgi:hypothetical protein
MEILLTLFIEVVIPITLILSTLPIEVLLVVKYT